MRIKQVDILKVGQSLLKIDNQALCRDFDLPSKNVKQLVSWLKGCKTYVVYDEEQPTGCFAYRVSNGVVTVETMAVIPQYQRKGVGRKMMNKLLKLVKGKKVRLVTHPKNAPAIILYLKFGFQIYGWKNDYYGDGQPRLLLELQN